MTRNRKLSLLNNNQNMMLRKHNVGDQYSSTSPITTIPDNDEVKTESWVKKAARSACTVQNVKHRLPITSWLPRYSLDDIVSDAIAGITVGLTVVPQGIAYAALAGLDVQYGLYSAFMGCFVYMFFGSCKDITIGPTAIMALMVQEHAPPNDKERAVVFAVMLTFLSGCIELLFGFCRLGVLINFISNPVTSGFVSAAAITIATSQLKSLLGIKMHAEGFIDTYRLLFQHITETKLYDLALGVVCIIILVFLKTSKEWKWGHQTDIPTWEKVVKKFIWVFTTARNAFIVLICAFIAYSLPDAFTMTGVVEGGLPGFHPPAFSLNTNGTHLDFLEITSELGSAIIIIPLIAILENVAIAKAFSQGKAVDATQEMIALGFSNLLGSFVSSMPTTGSFSRTAVNSSSGVKTPLGGLFTGTLVLLSLAFLTEYFYYIPKSTLAAVIICAVIYMVEFGELTHIWRSKKIDLVPWLGTFGSCLFIGLEYGIVIGVGISVLLLLYTMATPRIHVHIPAIDKKVVVVKPDRSIYFPAAENLRSAVTVAAEQHSSTVMVLDCSNMKGMDFTAAKTIESMLKDFDKRHQKLVFMGLKPSLLKIIDGLHLTKFVHIESLNDAVLDSSSVETVSITVDSTHQS